MEGRCAITRVPADRFNLDHFGHPRLQEKGRSYTWAAGVLEDIYGFDPLAFGISPREAPQLDPQQRILLQLTWEALEDSGIRPSSISGTEVGVYVGASLTEYAHGFIGDPAAGDSHFATGNSLAVIANRISYIFDLHGPSVTFDTACSSSLVALNAACDALRSGRVETAIVAGINIISAPTSFISFSQASMVSPTGLCRAFSEGADGFVRAEGGAVLVLRRSDTAFAANLSERGRIIASDVNSNGRTNGISLPSGHAQEELLRMVYAASGISSDELAFVEAHGTGTPAGDPIEAGAIGRGLGKSRKTSPLAIGSIKTNIGHLEAASGIAGVIKSLLALEHRVLPPTINFSAPNPNIDFSDLNIAVCREHLTLEEKTQIYAGVNSFGFGGTNAHVIVAGARDRARRVQPAKHIHTRPRIFTVSAHSKMALAALARDYRDRIASLADDAVGEIANAAAHRRDALAHRFAIASTSRDVVIQALDAVVADESHPALAIGEVAGAALPVAFVYSGNGSQWTGMGRVAYLRNSTFRARFDEIDEIFKKLSDWSLTASLFGSELDNRIALTSVAQPLVFAIQSAATVALRDFGLVPMVVLGHSVGEVAAAEACGALDLATAVKVIYFRSVNQETVRNLGRMVAVMAAAEAVERLLSRFNGIEIAAYNSSRAVTLAGPDDQIAEFMQLARQQGIACLDLGLNYPFHSSSMDSIRQQLAIDLHGILPAKGHTPFVSTASGQPFAGTNLGSDYWWRNVRQSVQFESAVRSAAELGARIFIEIGPRAILGKHISVALSSHGKGIAYFSAMDREDPENLDPLLQAAARALASGAEINIEKLVGAAPEGDVPLPTYPWQQTSYRLGATPEAIGWNDHANHPLSGSRFSNDVLQWRALVDTTLQPALSGHRVGDLTILPGTGFLEIALSVGSQWLGSEDLRLSDVEILRPLDITADETREVITRISADSHTVEILSRPRLSGAQLVLHARCRIARGAAPSRPIQNWPVGGDVVGGNAHYAVADASGLHYGHEFREVERITVHDRQHISVEMSARAASDRFLLDPFRLDCCAQGIIALFPNLGAADRGVAYVPVRLDEINLLKPRALPCRALIFVKHSNERSILADFVILDERDEIIATLIGVSCQAIPVRRMVQLDAMAFVERLKLLDGSMTDHSGFAESVSDVVHALELHSNSTKSHDEGFSLLEGFATMAAYEIIAALGDGNGLDVELLVTRGLWPESLRPWLVTMLESLQAANLAGERLGAWHLIKDSLLPSANSILNTLAREHPERATDLLVAAELNAVAGQLAVRHRSKSATFEPISAMAFEFFDSFSSSIERGNELLLRAMEKIKGLLSSKRRSSRILQLGYSPQVKHLALLDSLQVTIFEPDKRRYQQAQFELARTPSVALVDTLSSAPQSFDLILASEMLHRLPTDFGMNELGALLAPGGLLVAIEPKRSLFRDMVFQFAAYGSSAEDQRHYQPAKTGLEWSTALRGAGFAEADHRDLGDSVLVVGKKRASSSKKSRVEFARNDDRPVIVILDTSSARNSELAAALEKDVAISGLLVVVGIGEIGTPLPVAAGDVLIQISSCGDRNEDDLANLSRRCLELKACAERIGASQAKVYLITESALHHKSGAVQPTSTGVWAFARTLANEFPNLDLCKVDLAADCPTAIAAQHIVAILSAGRTETELQIDKFAIRAVRIENAAKIVERAGSPAKAVRLERRFSVNQRVAWQPVKRRKPRRGEIEIEINATGLNFRDLMFSMGLLPDDILEDGLTGPSLGLECAGTVVEIGAAVSGVKVGDRVVAFTPSAFASHATIPTAQMIRIPKHISSEAAATIPVAFLTAYYSLVELAQLQRDEWVLIHGGAGAVGMAAIQIAQVRGAKVIATAGSVAKRKLLKCLGVEHVLNSRATTFTDEIKQIVPVGVAVVLNSLSGEAMERSISCLAPFGRFVELGKRDYVSNTRVGLRPFRKNLSYFGVDIDQIMNGRPQLGRELFSKIMSGFSDKTYSALPFTRFAGMEISSAFQLMQQSGHIGKIIVRPPKAGEIRIPSVAFSIDPRRTHLVTGAFGGFGLATVKWLADRGARHLVLVSRSGAASDEAKALVEELQQRGIEVLVQACDIGDSAAVNALFTAIGKTMPELSGIIHSAMVLDDATIANLSSEQLSRVLAPKVNGAVNLDRATRDMSLAYFVLYSSVTTLIGNPGQGSYVAANAFMEGLARRRRQNGLPALAVGWGPIADVGVVARNEKLQGSLRKLGGVRGMLAREALDLLAQALSVTQTDPALAVITIAPHEGGFSAGRLPILKSPTFAGFVNSTLAAASGIETIDLKALMATDDVETVRDLVTENVVAQLANVLHFRTEDIVHLRPLSDLGLDSLMALELAMKLEDCFGIQLQLTGSAGDLTVASLVDEIMAHANVDREDDENTVASTLAEKHFGDIETVGAAAFPEATGVKIYSRQGRAS